MNKLTIQLLTATAFLATAGVAQAQSSISWTYVEAAYQSTEYDLDAGGDIDGDGPRVAGSLQFLDFMHATASFQRSNLDDVFVPALGMSVDAGELDQYSIGVGVHSPVTQAATNRKYSDRFSAFFDAQYIDTDAETGGGDGDGWGVDAGVRMINFTSWEFIGSVGYENLQGVDGEITVKGRLLYQLLRNLQLQGGLDWNDNRGQWFLGVRYNFPKFRVF